MSLSAMRTLRCTSTHAKNFCLPSERQQQCQRTMQSLSVGPTTAVHSEMSTVTMVKDRVGINAGPIEKKIILVVNLLCRERLPINQLLYFYIHL